MTSKLVVNTIESDTGISSVSFGSSISLSSTSKFFFSGAGIDIGADTNINRPSAGVLGFNISSSERLRITSDGKFFMHGSNATSANNTSALLPAGRTLNIHGTGSNDGISVVRYSGSYGAYGVNIGRSRNDTFGTNTAVQSGDELGHVTFYGADGTNFDYAAQITGLCDGAVGTGGDATDMPGALSFRTTPEGSDTPTERVRILSNGRVHIRPSNTFYAMNSQSTDLVIGDGGGGRGITFWTAGAADNQTISFQTNETLSRAEGEISYGPTATSTVADRNAMMFRTNSAERLRIDSSGNVTKPTNFHILVDRSSNQTGYNASNISDNIIWNRVITGKSSTNASNHFNTSTGLFTAPVTGMYLFHVAVNCSYNVQGAWLNINGSRPGNTAFYPNGSQSADAMIAYHVTAGQTVGTKWYYNGITNGTINSNSYHTWWRIVLLG